MNEGLQMFWTVVFGAVIVQGIVDIVRQIETKNRDWRYWAALVVGLIGGVVVAYNWNFNFFRDFAGLGEGRIPYVGAVLTGLIMSRGANFVNDLWDRLIAYKKPGGLIG